MRVTRTINTDLLTSLLTNYSRAHPDLSPLIDEIQESLDEQILVSTELPVAELLSIYGAREQVLAIREEHPLGFEGFMTTLRSGNNAVLVYLRLHTKNWNVNLYLSRISGPIVAMVFHPRRRHE